MSYPQPESVTVPQFLKDIDANLDKYYKQRGYDDYFTGEVGKFSAFCIKHKIHTKRIFVNEELTETVENSVLKWYIQLYSPSSIFRTPTISSNILIASLVSLTK